MIDQKTVEEVNKGKGNWGLEDEVRNHCNPHVLYFSFFLTLTNCINTRKFSFVAEERYLFYAKLNQKGKQWTKYGAKEVLVRP